jgi:hypothetical protein
VLRFVVRAVGGFYSVLAEQWFDLPQDKNPSNGDVSDDLPDAGAPDAVAQELWALLDAFPVASSGRTPIRTANSLNSHRKSKRLRAVSSTSDSGIFSETADRRRPRTRMAFPTAKP